jgi:hypothetical protein
MVSDDDDVATAASAAAVSPSTAVATVVCSVLAVQVILANTVSSGMGHMLYICIVSDALFCSGTLGSAASYGGSLVGT